MVKTFKTLYLNNGIIIILGGAGFCPSTVAPKSLGLVQMNFLLGVRPPWQVRNVNSRECIKLHLPRLHLGVIDPRVVAKNRFPAVWASYSSMFCRQIFSSSLLTVPWFKQSGWTCRQIQQVWMWSVSGVIPKENSEPIITCQALCYFCLALDIRFTLRRISETSLYILGHNISKILQIWHGTKKSRSHKACTHPDLYIAEI